MRIHTRYLNISMLSLCLIFFIFNHVFINSLKEIKYYDQSTNLIHNKKEEGILHKLINSQVYDRRREEVEFKPLLTWMWRNISSQQPLSKSEKTITQKIELEDQETSNYFQYVYELIFKIKNIFLYQGMTIHKKRLKIVQHSQQRDLM